MYHFDFRHKGYIDFILSLKQYLWCLHNFRHVHTLCASALEVFMEKNVLKRTQLKGGNQILIPLHMRAVILERIDHRHRILIKCRERCRDAIWWSKFSQAVKRNVFSLQEAQTLWALWASHHSTIGCAPMVKAGKLLWWLKNLSRVQVASVSKVFPACLPCKRCGGSVGHETASPWEWDQQAIVLVFENCFFFKLVWF